MCAQTPTHTHITSLHGNFDDEITAIWQYILAEFQMAKIDTIRVYEANMPFITYIFEPFYYWHISFCCVSNNYNLEKNGGVARASVAFYTHFPSLTLPRSFVGVFALAHS